MTTPAYRTKKEAMSTTPQSGVAPADTTTNLADLSREAERQRAAEQKRQRKERADDFLSRRRIVEVDQEVLRNNPEALLSMFARCLVLHVDGWGVNGRYSYVVCCWDFPPAVVGDTLARCTATFTTRDDGTSEFIGWSS